jgi:hypothetical protein
LLGGRRGVQELSGYDGGKSGTVGGLVGFVNIADGGRVVVVVGTVVGIVVVVVVVVAGGRRSS